MHLSGPLANEARNRMAVVFKTSQILVLSALLRSGFVIVLSLLIVSISASCVKEHFRGKEC